MDPGTLENATTTALPLLVVALLLLELVRSARPSRASTNVRWLSNFGLGAINLGLGRLAAILFGVSTAILASAAEIGLFNLVSLTFWLELLLGVLLLDLAYYAEHRLFHAVPLLWRLHLVHHSDRDVDVTTNFRHHPGEWLVAYAIALIVITAFGIPAVAVVFAAVLHEFTGVIQHANVRLPAGIDRAIRTLLVTPGMHVVHHSSRQPETDSNFGQLFSFWDRLFGTYVAEPVGGRDRMDLGLGVYTDNRSQWVDQVLAQPLTWRTPPSVMNDTAED